MHIRKLTILFFFIFVTPLFSQPQPGSVKSITEEDGSPDVYPWQIKFSNGSVTDNNDGTVSVSSSGGVVTGMTLDLGDDSGNDSTALVEIAITGDTNSIFTESEADKLLIAVANDWPTADEADNLSTTGYDNLEAHDMTWTGAHEFQSEFSVTGSGGATILFSESTSNPTVDANQGALYSKDLNGDTVPYWRLQSNGTVNKVIIESEIDLSSEIDDLVIDDTGSGALVFNNSPLITGPTINSSLNTNFLIGSRFVTTNASGSLSSVGSSANLSSTIIDETGSSVIVFNNSPTITGPTIHTSFVVEQTGGTDIMTGAVGGIKLTDQLILPGGSNPNMEISGKIDIDISDRGQLLWMSASTVRSIPGTQVKCALIENLATTDDNFSLGSLSYPVTIEQIWCECDGTCTTTTGLTFEDDAANAMTITSTPSCATGSSIPVPVLVTAGGSLAARESWQFDVGTISPDGSDEYTVCWEYSVNRQ